jgi:trehalose/maltose hydrolase-like predicted phosphorylase
LMDDGLKFEPRLPPAWKVLNFRVQWRGRHVEIGLDAAQRRLSATLQAGEQMRLDVGNQGHTLELGQVWEALWDEPEVNHKLDHAA